MFAFAVSARYNGYATVTQGGLDVFEVKVYFTFCGDYFRYRASGGGKCVVGFVKRVVKRKVGIYLYKTLIVDHKQCVDIL